MQTDAGPTVSEVRPRTAGSGIRRFRVITIVSLFGVLSFFHFDGSNLGGWTWVAQGERFG